MVASLGVVTVFGVVVLVSQLMSVVCDTLDVAQLMYDIHGICPELFDYAASVVQL